MDDHPGIRVFLKARYEPLAVPLTVDVTTGDRITPAAMVYEYPFVFDEGAARIMAYPLETVLAEKLETILSRNVATTRIRDFYDAYELWCVKGDTVDPRLLRAALEATCGKRNSWGAVERRNALVEAMRADGGLARQWEAYVAKHSYAKGIAFSDTLEAVSNLLEAALSR